MRIKKPKVFYSDRFQQEEARVDRKVERKMQRRDKRARQEAWA